MVAVNCQRSASDVVVPNVVSTTFAEIKASGVCEAFHGSLRVYMDSHPTERFGAFLKHKPAHFWDNFFHLSFELMF